MIRLGYSLEEKRATVAAYAATHPIRKVVVLYQRRFSLDLPELAGVGVAVDPVEWSAIIEYRDFYRLVQETGPDTLIVLHECLRTQNRHDLTYNCIRHFLNQTPHQIVFQRLPLIDTVEDLMILVDFDTRSRFKRERFRHGLLAGLDVDVRPADVEIQRMAVETDPQTRDLYAREKRRLIDGIGLKDPHTIPRNLLLLAGKAKLRRVDPFSRYLGRNNRFGLSNLATYRDVAELGERLIFEPCHNFIDFADALAVTGQRRAAMLVSDLKVDGWYYERFTAWTQRIRDAYAALHG